MQDWISDHGKCEGRMRVQRHDEEAERLPEQSRLNNERAC